MGVEVGIAGTISSRNRPVGLPLLRHDVLDRQRRSYCDVLTQRCVLRALDFFEDITKTRLTCRAILLSEKPAMTPLGVVRPSVSICGPAGQVANQLIDFITIVTTQTAD
jgi:hypothetical protein